ncbi:MAG TPA: ABC transporter substrate-binding protein [Acidimicrobiales bacterium]|nr:ABC transporter substrate-binding protein [Acidimicrobiales bacterium]
MRKRLSVAMAVMVCAGTLAVVAPATTAGASSGFAPIPQGPITFGVSTPTSGAQASYGTFTKLGITEALKAFNAEHPNGIDGHQVKVQIIDDASDVTKAVQAANQIVASKDAAVITVSYNPAADAQQLAVFTKAKMPVVANLSGLQYSDTKTYPYLFSPNSSIQQYVLTATQWMKKKGFTKVAMLNDGIATDVAVQNEMLKDMKTEAPQAKVVASTTITPGSVDDSAAITKLKASGAELLVVNAGVSYGPIWNAVQAANWSPTILTSAGAWYDGFSAMGPLQAKASAYYYNCADSTSQVFSTSQQSLMAAYSAATGGAVTNYLTFIATDSIPLELLNYAITKYHSIDPNAIKKAIEGIHNQSFLGFKYNFSATNHYGLIGQFGAATCLMAPPYAGGVGKVPIKG